MKKQKNLFRIRKSLFGIFLLTFFIFTVPLALSGCGGGGSGSGSNSSSRSPAPVIISPPIFSPPSLISNTMNVYLDAYADEGSPDIPYVNVYINGSSMPIHLILDTGATGIMINQSALTNAGISASPSGYIFSGSFADQGTYSGSIDYADVSTKTGSSGLTAQNIPIAVAVTDTDFPSNGFLQGDFGMGLSPYYSFGYYNLVKTLFTPSFVTAISNGNYNNGFILDFNGLSFTNGYDIISNPQTTPVGTITFGLNTALNNSVPSGSDFYMNNPSEMQASPYITAEFGGNSNNSQGDPFYIFFDTGTPGIYLGTSALNYGIENGASPNDVISSGICQNQIIGGLTFGYGLYTSVSWINNYFITEPNSLSYNSFCDYTFLYSNTTNALALDNWVYYDINITNYTPGQETFGLSFIFNQPMFWQAQTSISSWGVGIEP